METAKNKKEGITIWKPIFTSVIASVIISVFSGAIILHGKIERMDERTKNLEKQIEEVKTQVKELETKLKTIDVQTPDTSISENPSQLTDIIKEKQKQYVRISRTENDCFTSENLASFKKERIPDKIVAELMEDNHFIDLIISIKNMSPAERQKLLDRCANTSKSSWAELGKITPEGQTEDGKNAELLIARAIVAEVKKISNLPLEKIKTYYK